MCVRVRVVDPRSGMGMITVSEREGELDCALSLCTAVEQAGITMQVAVATFLSKCDRCKSTFSSLSLFLCSTFVRLSLLIKISHSFLLLLLILPWVFHFQPRRYK